MKLRIARNALYNFMGGGVPALITLVTVPIIVRELGDSGYGLFTLILAIIGYFALPDVNVTAGSVKYVAKYTAERDQEGVNQTVSFGLMVYLGIGLVGAGLIFFNADFLIQEVFTVPRELTITGKTSLEIAAFGFLVGQLQVYLQSVPQALLRYDTTSKIEMGFGTGLPLGTVMLLVAGYGLVEVIAFRVIASLVNCAILWRSIKHLIPDFSWTVPSIGIVRELVEFSIFSFLSRFAALTYAYADKLIIGAVLGVKELAYYTIAATLANRVLGLIYRVPAVLFPATSMLAARGEHVYLETLYLKASRYVGFINASVLILLSAFAEPILQYWIGADFAVRGALVLKLIAIAMFIDSLTNIPSLVNDGVGHPRVSGSFALARAIFGLIALYLLVALEGIEGAAWGHVISAAFINSLFLVYIHGRTVPCSLHDLIYRSYSLPMLGVILIGGLTALFVHIAAGHTSWLAVTMLASVSMLLIFGFSLVLLPSDRGSLTAYVSDLIARRS